MREEEKALAGLLYAPGDPELVAMKLKAHNLNTDYNKTYEDEKEKRNQILDELIPNRGANCRIQGPVYFHYGKHVIIGENFFANFNLTIQDDTLVKIGDNCNFGPNVTIVTPLHPMLGEERRQLTDKDGNEKHLCYAKPVTIGNDCWFGAGVIVCPGVTIGDNCTIGAGSVVTRDIPANTFAAGNPCKVIRPLTEKDSIKYKSDILTDDIIF